MTADRQSAMRRYPALLWLAGAVLLALLLPTALNVPNSGPSSLAEYAPVPGQGQGDSPVAELGQASSAGIGAGGTSGATALEDDTLAGPQAKATRRPVATKRCVGKPPRQTEDPNSPPCVAYFEGDNGGATTRGVTRDEIRIVLHMGPAPSPVYVDYDNPAAQGESSAQADFGVAARAFQRYFNDRFQTYGRRLHFYGYAGPGTDTQPDQLRAQIVAIDDKWRPFAVVPVGTFSTQVLAHEGASKSMVVVSYGAYDRAAQVQDSPYLLTYSPDLQDQAALAASLVCNELAGRPARLSGNVTDQSKTRTFGLLWQDNAQVPEYRILKDEVKRRIADQCGLRDLPEAAARTTNEGQADYTQNIAAMQAAGVTTVLFFSSSTGPGAWGRSADAAKYYPEWVIPGSNEGGGVDTNSQARLNPPLVWANAVGVSYAVRRGPLNEQQWYQVAQEGCGGCALASDARFSRLYNQLLVLMWGVQSAGPRLTAQNVDKGLHAITPRPSADPYAPAAYFAAGNWSWVKDAMAIWWDPTGTEPGTGQPGCYRLVESGRRYRAGEWPAGDAGFKGAGQPCQGPDK